MSGDRHSSQHLVNINLFKLPNYSMKEGLYVSFLLLCKKKSIINLAAFYYGVATVDWVSRHGLAVSSVSGTWVFTGRTDAEAETPALWPPHAKS